MHSQFANPRPVPDCIRLRSVGFGEDKKNDWKTQGTVGLLNQKLTVLFVQNGLSTTRITIPIISRVGISLMIR